MRSSVKTHEAANISMSGSGSWSQNAWAEVPGSRTVIRGAGLLLCAANLIIVMNNAPLYDFYFRWLIDSYVPIPQGWHNYANIPASAFQGFPQRMEVRAQKRVKAGLHSVGLQYYTDASPGTSNSITIPFSTVEIRP